MLLTPKAILEFYENDYIEHTALIKLHASEEGERKQDEFDRARLLLNDYIEKRDAHAFQDGNAYGFKNGLKVGREEMRQTVFNALDNMAIDIAANSAATYQQIKKLIYNL